MFIIGLILAGLIVGALGRLVHPGPDPIPIWLTIVIGIAASLVAGLLLPFGGVFRFILAVVIAALLVGVAGNRRGARSV
jgi:uncharacterized membrane protein YeaQ/YmgE (transglycosylase-associated protein family)